MRSDSRNRRANEEDGVDLTPMLDVVFIMLIFFIVTASFIKERAIDISRPDAPPTTTESKSILVTITASDQIWMGLRLIDIRSIRANVERMLAENPEAPVVVNADAESTNGIFVTVLDQARLAGAMKVSLAATD